MKTKYLIIGLKEMNVLTTVSLSSSGVTEYAEMVVVGYHIDTVESIAEAVSIAESKADDFEHGIEIKTVYSN